MTCEGKSFKRGGFTFEVEEYPRMVDTDIVITMKKGSDEVGYAHATLFPRARGTPASAQRNRLYLRPDCRGMGFGSLLSDALNDYLLGKQKVKPPFKPQRISLSFAENPKVARKLVEQGYHAPGFPARSPAYSTVRNKTFEKVFVGIGSFVGDRDFLLKRRAYRRRTKRTRPRGS